jgi:hypothetical protein
MKIGAERMKEQIERSPQKYRFLDTSRRDKQIGIKTENLSELKFLDYGGDIAQNGLTYRHNVSLRVNALCGYRNEFAMKKDPLAINAIGRIMADELRVADLTLKLNSTQTQA